MANSIAIARRQRVFAVLEDSRGVAKWPTAADFIRPSGDATIKQSPEFKDSEEKRDTLDVLDQFSNVLPPCDWSLPTYVRAVGLGQAPQAEALFISMQGKKNDNTKSTAALGTAMDNAVTTVVAKTPGLSGAWPAAGVLRIDTEDIAYTAYDSVTRTFSGCTRGYNGTTKAAHVVDAAISLKSLVYLQDTVSPSFTLYVQTDHLVQRAVGCTVTKGVLAIDNEGAVTLNFEGQGMLTTWAGTCTLAANAAAAQTSVVVPNSALYCVGMRIWNKTKADTNSGAGYEITAINTTTNALTLATNLPTGGWSIGDTVAGYLPDGDALGSVLESRNTTIKINGVAGKFKSTDLTFNVPKKFVDDEVGTMAPEDYLENVRSIESDMKIYFRRDDARYFKEGMDGKEVAMELTFGKLDGKKLVVRLPRCKLKMPTINFAAPAVEFSMPLKALGTSGEDSAEIRME